MFLVCLRLKAKVFDFLRGERKSLLLYVQLRANLLKIKSKCFAANTTKEYFFVSDLYSLILMTLHA